MNIIVCLDDKNGMLFNKRRQSSDSSLRLKVLEITKGKKLFMNEYTKKQFTEECDNIIVDEQFLISADADDYAFIENTNFNDKIDSVKKIIIFRWNRVYPSDVKFDADLLKTFIKVDFVDFKGNSHDKITMEVYERV